MTERAPYRDFAKGNYRAMYAQYSSTLLPHISAEPQDKEEVVLFPFQISRSNSLRMFWSSIAKAPLSYSVRSACTGSTRVAFRAAKQRAANPTRKRSNAP